MRPMEQEDKVVWLVRNKEGNYLTSIHYWSRNFGSLRAAHIWKRKGDANNHVKPTEGETLVPFALVEVDPDSIPARAPKPVTKSPELERMLESKI